MEERIIKIVAHQTRSPEKNITLQTNLEEDLGTDSLDNIEIALALEEEFLIEIPNEDGKKLKTISDIVAYIKGKLK